MRRTRFPSMPPAADEREGWHLRLHICGIKCAVVYRKPSVVKFLLPEDFLSWERCEIFPDARRTKRRTKDSQEAPEFLGHFWYRKPFHGFNCVLQNTYGIRRNLKRPRFLIMAVLSCDASSTRTHLLKRLPEVNLTEYRASRSALGESRQRRKRIPIEFGHGVQMPKVPAYIPQAIRFGHCVYR